MIHTLVLGGWAMPPGVYDSVRSGGTIFDYGFFSSGQGHIRMPSTELLDGKCVVAHSMGAIIALKLVEQGARPAKLVLHSPFARFTATEGYTGVPVREVEGMKRLLARNPEALVSKFLIRCAGSDTARVPELPECLNITALQDGLDILAGLDMRHTSYTACECFIPVRDPLLVSAEMTSPIGTRFRINVLSDSHLPYSGDAHFHAQNFSRAAGTYDANAPFQSLAADSFAHFTAAGTANLKVDTVFEAGCGTGLVTARLEKLFPDAKFTVCDASPSMLEQAHSKVPSADCCAGTFEDAALFASKEGGYSLVVSSMALQWSENLEHSLAALLGMAAKDGAFFFSIPLDGTFASLRRVFEEARLPYPGLRLPSKAELENILERLAHGGYKIEYHTEEICFDGLREFLRTLKLSGTANSSGVRTDSVALKKMIMKNSAPFRVEYYYATVKIEGFIASK